MKIEPPKWLLESYPDRERLKELQAELIRLPDIRGDRVEGLRQAVRSGGYRVSSKKIADAVFCELLEQPLFRK